MKENAKTIGAGGSSLGRGIATKDELPVTEAPMGVARSGEGRAAPSLLSGWLLRCGASGDCKRRAGERPVVVS